ncbi:D-alanyl-D-alanine carboxypeptidase family protein, partial [Patescibacteria group bacterium]
KKFKKNKKEKVFIGLITLFFGWFFMNLYFSDLFFDKKEVVVEISNEKIDYFSNLDLKSKAVFVWDMREKEVLFEKNSEAQLPLASLTKLMTGWIASEIVPKGTLVAIDQNDMMEEGDQGLLVGEKWTLGNMIDFTLVTSSNDGARALTSLAGYGQFLKEQEERKIFIDKMNSEAKKIGLTQTFFLSESGLDLSESLSGSYGSAKDTAFLIEYILEQKPFLLEATTYPDIILNSSHLKHEVINTNKIISEIPGVLASKTGFTDLAGGNLVTVFDAGINHPVVVVVLGSGINERFEDIEKLVWSSILSISS